MGTVTATLVAEASGGPRAAVGGVRLDLFVAVCKLLNRRYRKRGLNQEVINEIISLLGRVESLYESLPTIQTARKASEPSAGIAGPPEACHVE